MKDNIILLEEYKRDLQNKELLDRGEISLEDLSLEELDGVNELYIKEIKIINREIEKNIADIERLKKENSYLRKLIRKEDN